MSKPEDFIVLSMSETEFERMLNVMDCAAGLVSFYGKSYLEEVCDDCRSDVKRRLNAFLDLVEHFADEFAKADDDLYGERYD